MTGATGSAPDALLAAVNLERRTGDGRCGTAYFGSVTVGSNMSACGAAVEAIHDAFDQDNLALGRCCELRAVRPKQASRAVGLAVTTGGDVLSGHPLRAINLSHGSS